MELFFEILLIEELCAHIFEDEFVAGYGFTVFDVVLEEDCVGSCQALFLGLFDDNMALGLVGGWRVGELYVGG